MGTTDDRTHEEKVARLLELEEAREARRKAWRRALPWIAIALVAIGIATGLIVHQRNEQAREDCRVGQMFDSMVGSETRDC